MNFSSWGNVTDAPGPRLAKLMTTHRPSIRAGSEKERSRPPAMARQEPRCCSGLTVPLPYLSSRLLSWRACTSSCRTKGAKRTRRWPRSCGPPWRAIWRRLGARRAAATRSCAAHRARGGEPAIHLAAEASASCSTVLYVLHVLRRRRVAAARAQRRTRRTRGRRGQSWSRSRARWCRSARQGWRT